MLYTFELIFFALHIIQTLDHISFVSTTFEVSCLSPSSFFFSKNKTIIYRYLYNKKFVVNQEIIYLLSLTTFPTIWSTLKRSRYIFPLRFEKKFYTLWFLRRLNSEKIGTWRSISRRNFHMLKKSRDRTRFYAYQSVCVSLEISRYPAL